MPLKFWKKEKPEKGKEKEEQKAKAPLKPAPLEKKPEAAKPEAAKAEAKPAPETAAPATLAAVVDEVHARLVGLGLTVPPTKAVFTKRVASFPGGEAAFAKQYESDEASPPWSLTWCGRSPSVSSRKFASNARPPSALASSFAIQPRMPSG